MYKEAKIQCMVERSSDNHYQFILYYCGKQKVNQRLEATFTDIDSDIQNLKESYKNYLLSLKDQSNTSINQSEYLSIILKGKISNSGEPHSALDDIIKRRQRLLSRMADWLSSVETNPDFIKIRSDIDSYNRISIALICDEISIWFLDWEEWFLSKLSHGYHTKEDLTVFFLPFGKNIRKQRKRPFYTYAPLWICSLYSLFLLKAVDILSIQGNDKLLSEKFEHNLSAFSSVIGKEVSSKPLFSPSIPELVSTLHSKSYQILYFIGHGDEGIEIKEGTSIRFSDDRVFATTFKLGHIFPINITKAIQQGLTLVILNSCLSAKYASSMITLKLPLFIGWMYVVDVDVADDFLTNFLNYFIRKGESIEWAVHLAWLETQNKFSHLLPFWFNKTSILVVRDPDILQNKFTWNRLLLEQGLRSFSVQGFVKFIFGVSAGVIGVGLLSIPMNFSKPASFQLDALSVPGGFMAPEDEENVYQYLKHDKGENEDCKPTISCDELIYTSILKTGSSAGIVWWPHQCNWKTLKNKKCGINLYKISNLNEIHSFELKAKGQNGGEEVQFMIGTHDIGPYRPFSSISSLTQDWQTYKVSLNDLDLSHSSAVFTLMIPPKQSSEQITFFLADAKFVGTQTKKISPIENFAYDIWEFWN